MYIESNIYKETVRGFNEKIMFFLVVITCQFNIIFFTEWQNYNFFDITIII